MSTLIIILMFKNFFKFLVIGLKILKFLVNNKTGIS